MSPNRRDVLRASGAAALLTGGLAGCTEQIREAAPGGLSAPAYATWLYDPGELFPPDAQGFLSVDVAAYREREGALPSEVTDQVEESTDEATDMSVEDFERVTLLSAYADESREAYGDQQQVVSVVGTGSFDTGALSSRATERADLTEHGEYEGYTLYRRRTDYDPSRTNAVAISEETVVGATTNAKDREEDDEGGYGGDGGTPSATPRDGVTAEAAVKLHIDAEAGSTGRLVEGSDTLSTAVEDLGEQPMVGAVAVTGDRIRSRTGLDESREGESDTTGHVRDLTEGFVGLAGSATTEEGTGDVTIRLYYEDEALAGDRAETVRALRDELEAESDALQVPDVDVSTDGASVVVVVRGDPSAFYDELTADEERSERQRAPQVSFSFDYEVEAGSDAGPLTVTHDGGDTVQSDQLQLLAQDGTPDTTWVEAAGGEDGDGEVTAGDRVTVEADTDDTLRVIWRSAEGGTAATLAKWVGPDA